MAANNLVWYAGRCLKRAEHDKGAQLEAAVQQIDGAWRPIESRKALFKNMDSLEWRSTEARHVRLLEWVAFTLTPTGLKAKPWQAGQHRRLYWYADYSAEGGQEQLHRRLSTRGVKLPHLTGIWILRCASDSGLKTAGGCRPSGRQPRQSFGVPFRPYVRNDGDDRRWRYRVI
jgi:hypothetical protein